MDDTKREELEKACKKEKDHKVRTRIVAVRMVRVLNMSVDETASIMVTVPRGSVTGCSVMTKEDLKAHSGSSQIGRPRRITRWTPSLQTWQAAVDAAIHTKTGTSLHITYVRKIMRLYNLSPKVAQKIHINRANRKAVTGGGISCLEKEGFAVIMQDRRFSYDTVSGRKY